MKRLLTAIALAAILVFTFLWIHLIPRPWRAHSRTKVSPDSQVVYASGGGSFNPQAMIAEPNGGVAQYGIAMMNSTSAAATLAAIQNFNAYAAGRSGWSLSSANVNRLATADWNARAAGNPAITAQQIATAATALINNQLATMTAAQQQSMIISNLSISTPSGRLGLNPGYPYVSEIQNPNGTFTFTVTADAFSVSKADFQQLAPTMISAGSNFYPAEAVLVGYSVASWDMGFGNDFIAAVQNRLGNLTGLNLTNQPLYGPQGYMIRRPLTTFLTDQAMSQFFTSLGF